MKYLYSLIILLILFANCSQNDSSQAKKELRKIARTYNNNICKTTYADSVVYYEYGLHNDKYVMFNYASGYILSMGYDCQIPIDNFCFIFTNFAKSHRKPEWLDYLKYLYANRQVKHRTDIAPAYNSAINCFRRFELFGPVNKKHIDDFVYFELQSKSNSIKKIGFKSINPQKDFFGTIFYDKVSNNIIKVELDSCKFYSNAFDQFKTAKVIFNYVNQDKLFLSSIYVDFKSQDLEQIISIKILGNATQPFTLDNNEWNSLTCNDIRPIIEYHPNDSIMLQHPEFKDIRKDLEHHDKKLEVQFFENNGQEYFKSVLVNGLKDNEIKPERYNKLRDKIIKKYRTK